MAAMLSKFRIDYSDVIVITDITKKPADSTRAYFDSLTKQFMKNEVGQGNNDFRLEILKKLAFLKIC